MIQFGGGLQERREIRKAGSGEFLGAVVLDGSHPVEVGQKVRKTEHSAP